MSFVHLHCHSHYSLLDGLAKPKDMVARAKELEMPGLALTDHGSMYGAIEFYQLCTNAGIKPILGCELYLAPNKMTDKRPGIDNKRYHLLVLVKNETGYRNLMKLISLANMEGYYYKPRVDFPTFAKYAEGLIVTSGCLASEIGKAALSQGKDRVIEIINRYRQVVGNDNYYIELQNHSHIPEQGQLNEILLDIATTMNIPIVATNDAHYATKEDDQAHDVLLCIQTNKQVDEKQRMSMLEDDFSIKSPELMRQEFAHVPQSIDNTLRILEQCNLEIKFNQDLIPRFTVPGEKTESEYLRELCFEGIKDRYGITVSDIKNVDKTKIKVEDESKLPVSKEEIVERLEYELGVVEKMGFPGYFLIVWDFIRYAREQGIFVGPGRGSAAGAILAYSIGITDIDPMKYHLMFERFLNPDRISMPDIDIDFEDTRRDEVIRYVQEKYGHDKVCQIVTFGTMAAKAAVKDVGRVYGIPFGEMNDLAGKIPSKPGTKLADALEKEPELKDAYDSNEQYQPIIDTALKLEGTVRQTGVHACAVIICNQELTRLVPIQYAPGSDEVVISQYSMKPLEDLGLLKMDFLGLRNLSILRNTLEIIKRRKNIDINLNNIPLDDTVAYDVFARGDTVGVFQFESSGMRRYLRDLKPTVFDDIIAMVALYRPGPMQFIDSFIARKHGREQITYEHPLMEDALKDTYGITVYQEQVMKLSRDMAKFTGGQADTLRKAIGKKKADLMAKMKDEFIAGCVKSGITEATCQAIWKQWEAFAQYCFNKSHAACYALIAYQTAYLKAHYPAEFMAALMSADQDNTDRVTIDIEECKKMGINVYGPHVNLSLKNFTVVDETHIRFGFKAIKNCGKGVIENIIAEREDNGEFKSLEDFMGRVEPHNLNKKSLESLIKSGAMDDFGDRGMLIENMETLLQYAKKINQEKSSGQVSLFGGGEDGNNLQVLKLISTEPIDKRQQLAWEKEFLGFYLSEHPFSEYNEKLKNLILPSNQLAHQFKGVKVTIGGMLTRSKKFTTKKGDLMLFGSLEDLYNAVELVVFPRAYKKTAHVWQDDALVIVKGKISDKDRDVKILVDDAMVINDDNIDKIYKRFGNGNVPSNLSLPPLTGVNDFAETAPMPGPAPAPIPAPTESKITIAFKQTPSQAQVERAKAILSQCPEGQTSVYIKIQGKPGLIKTSYQVLLDVSITQLTNDLAELADISYN